MNTDQVNELLLQFLTECVSISYMRDADLKSHRLDVALNGVLKQLLDHQMSSSDELGIDYEDGV